MHNFTDMKDYVNEKDIIVQIYGALYYKIILSYGFKSQIGQKWLQ